MRVMYQADSKPYVNRVFFCSPDSHPLVDFMVDPEPLIIHALISLEGFSHCDFSEPRSTGCGLASRADLLESQP